MKLKVYHLDAFTDKIFTGNPAVVCPLGGQWLPDATMQSIASENNLSETAFYIEQNGHYQIRWFTPKQEVDLCGHATLAAAFVLFNLEGYTQDTIHFESRSGVLSVRKDKELLIMDFPADVILPVSPTEDLNLCFNLLPEDVYVGKTDYLFVYGNQEQIEQIQPHLQHIGRLKARGIMVTAPGRDSDFVSRFFAPGVGVNEDPVTGSAHTTLCVYWNWRLKKEVLTAIQLSERKGHLSCRMLKDRVEISGKAILYMQGEIELA